MKIGICSLAIVVLALSACGRSLSGEYGEMSNDQWETGMTFTDDVVELNMLVSKIVTPYELRDGRIHVVLEGTPWVFPIDKKGCIDASSLALGRLCKKR